MHHKTLSIFFAFLSFFAYVAVGAPVQLSQLIKRDYHTVQHAVHGIGAHIGKGVSGDVHELKNTYKGHHAVIKVIKPNASGGHWSPGPGTEAQNAHHVGQLLGHGYDAHTKTHYLVMKHMGVSAQHAGLHRDDDITRLNNEANARYLAQHGVENRDKNGGNYVYHNRNGATQAEIVDWARTRYEGGVHPPPPVHVENVSAPHQRNCPTCVIH